MVPNPTVVYLKRPWVESNIISKCFYNPNEKEIL